MDKLKFNPTKTWIRGHRKHPEDCKFVCYCIHNDWTTEYGFCVGFEPDSKDSPDIVSFCCSYYDPSTQKPATHQFLWHPQEASWIATILSLAVTESFELIPQYRELICQLANERGIGTHKSKRS